ncbi:BatD family protein [Fulvivirga lutea]|uniref:BatD family protein n=1 Tax=Fulvivirga lutea TaxID=2810512 RepID=A0A974WHJ1_9BACT|nr:BatD family protein [Fulvivirga lutea]QSE98491.1 BatD family protein [Fulvivirga lutea]
MKSWIFTFCFVLTGLCSKVIAQEIDVKLGPNEIGENQAWTITITVSNERLQSYDDFPDIEGFQKRGTSSSSSTQIINGQISSSQSITMTYVPQRQGQVNVPAFTMTVNGKKISSPGTTVKVGAPVQRQRSRDPFRSLFDRDPFDDFGGRGETEFIDIDEDAFLALTTNKKEIYVGEGVTATLSFFVAESNRAPLQFYELGKQLSGILKDLRPENCWEENFNIENINGESVEINRKRYTQYKIYQGAFYPLNAENINFPQVGLEMIKYKVARNPSFFGQNRQEDFKTFYSKPKTVKVKQLPPHPLKDQVAVGDYHLSEDINQTETETGQSFSYQFGIYGEGNVSAVNKPMIDSDNNFDFYEPNVTQNINRRGGRVTGSKSFSYYGIPKEPGEYKLGDYFQWVFFNPNNGKYDTLKSEKVLSVIGESKKNESIQSNDLGSFYDEIEFADNTLESLDNDDWIQLLANLLILGMLVTSAVIFLKK